MNIYVWDFGFDFAAVQDSHTLSYLQNGLVLNGKPVLPNGFNVHDTLTLNVYNLTAGASQADVTQILTANVSFKAAINQQNITKPFNSITAKTGTADSTGASAIFGNNLPRWTGTAVQIATAGSFLFTVALTILGPGTNNFRTFVVDPEMIVEGTPAPG